LAPYLVASSPQGNPPDGENGGHCGATCKWAAVAIFWPHRNQDGRSALLMANYVKETKRMNGIIYLVGLVVVVLAVLSLFGLR